jgi:ATP-dependent DNA ligase
MLAYIRRRAASQSWPRYPARLIVFDLLADKDGKLTNKPLSERRAGLEKFMKAIAKSSVMSLSNATRSAATARRWLGEKGLDGIMAKRLDEPYRPGERTMRKFKVWPTIDAVLAGYYEDEATGKIDSLLFGLYGDDGLLDFVGHSRVYGDADEIAKLLEPLKGGIGFTGRSPGGKSRWTGKAQKIALPNRPPGVLPRVACRVRLSTDRGGAPTPGKHLRVTGRAIHHPSGSCQTNVRWYG